MTWAQQLRYNGIALAPESNNLLRTMNPGLITRATRFGTGGQSWPFDVQGILPELVSQAQLSLMSNMVIAALQSPVPIRISFPEHDSRSLRSFFSSYIWLVSIRLRVETRPDHFIHFDYPTKAVRYPSSNSDRKHYSWHVVPVVSHPLRCARGSCAAAALISPQEGEVSPIRKWNDCSSRDAPLRGEMSPQFLRTCGE